MPVGQADWTPSGQSPIQTASVDIGELAARLGSAVNYDRTGKLLYQDTFTRLDGLWAVVDGGYSAAPAADTARAEYGGSSLKTTLQVGTAKYYGLSRYFKTWQDEKLSVEIACNFNFMPNLIHLGFSTYKEQVSQIAAIELRNNCTELYVLVSGLTYTAVFTGHTYELTTARFNTIKLDIDFSTLYYRQLRIDDKLYDLSSYAVHEGTLAVANQSLIDLSFYGHATQAVVHYLDRVIFTIDD